MKIDKLISPEYNPREITDKEMEKLKRSIEEFGYVDPIIVNKHNNHIIGGNQRYEVLKALDYDEVEVVYVDEKDPNREKALNIALNKISGEWDFEKLDKIFEEMRIDDFDISITGFDEDLEYDTAELDDLYTEEDEIQDNIRASNFDDEWEYNKKLFFTNEVDQDLFYDFIDKLKEKYGNESISENILAYLDEHFNEHMRMLPFKSDFEMIFKTEEEEEKFREHYYALRKRYPKVKDPFIEYIKEFNDDI